jgi:hypothetical protein
MNKAAFIAISAICSFFFSGGCAMNTSSDETATVTFSVDSGKKYRYELMFPVPPSLTCEGYLKNRENDTVFENAYRFRIGTSEFASVFIHIIVLFEDFTKEDLKQGIEFLKTDKTVEHIKITEIEGKRFRGFIDIHKYDKDYRYYNASVLLYMDNRFFISIFINDTVYTNPDDVEKFLKDIFTGIENTKVLDSNGNAVSAREEQYDEK